MSEIGLVLESVGQADAIPSVGQADPQDVERFNQLMEAGQQGNVSEVQAVSNAQYKFEPTSVSPTTMLVDGLMDFGSGASKDYSKTINDMVEKFDELDPMSPTATAELLDINMQFTVSSMHTNMAIGAAQSAERSFNALFKLQG